MGKKRVKFNLQTASCGPCLREAETNIKAATAFCKSCSDFLCIDCLKRHRRLVAMENHQIINRDHRIGDTLVFKGSEKSWEAILELHREKIAGEISKLNPNVLKKYEEFKKQTLESMRSGNAEEQDSFEEEAAPPVVYKFTEPCVSHPEEVIKFYCFAHSKLCCEICKLLDHKQCLLKVKYIPDEIHESNGNFQTEPFKHINELIEEFKEYDRDLQNDIRELKRSKETFLRDLQTKKRDILNWLNSMEVRAVRRVESVFNRCKQELDTKRKQAKTAREELRAEMYFLKEIMRNERNDDIYKFIKSKNAERVIDTCASRRSHRKFTNSRFALKLYSDFARLREEVTDLYALKFEIRGEDKYRVRLKEDKFVCDITGCTLLSNGDIVLADRQNSKIKQFNSKFRPLSHIYLQDGVFDLCSISPIAIIASSPAKSMLHILELQDEIEIAKSLDVSPGKCWGVDHHEGNFFVNISVGDNSFVRVIDLDGEILYSFCTLATFNLTIRFEDMKYNIVTVTSFVEENKAEVEFCLKEQSDETNSVTLSQYNFLKHLHTKGVALDRHDNVVVCCPDVDQIYTISKSGDEAELMLAESDGLDKPQSLVYNADKTRLLVTSENTDFIQLFKFEYQKDTT